MKTIAIFTTTRAEFGILKPLIRELNNDSEINTLVFVGGTHLCKEHGYTIEEITKSNINITQTFDYLLNEDSSFSLAKSSGIETIELAHIFKSYQPDAVCVLGDRYELIPIVLTAILYKKIIIHIHGGEKTEGAIDEQIRHMITKAAHIHFVACEDYANNILHLGEEKFRVFNTGALAVDNMVSVKLKPKKEIFSLYGLDIDKPTILMTYHPVTLETEISPKKQIENIFSALNKFNFQIIITAPNIDSNREEILRIIKNKVKENKNYKYIESLGVINFHNIIPYCDFVIGNSSSGIIEVPYYKKPTINIGIRQAGRIQHKSIINCDYDVVSVENAINKAMSKKFKEQLISMKYKFGNGKTAKKMVKIIKSINFDKKLLIKKLTF